MNGRLKNVLSFTIMSTLAFMLGFGTTLVVLYPSNSLEACDCAENAHWSDQPIRWQSPIEDGTSYKTHWIALNITRDEFRMSMGRDVPRSSTIFLGCTYVALIDPDDKYVRAVAEYISEVTEGYSDRMRATAALNFVQTGISYCSDEELYGCDDFCAAPLETLYLKKGDCEDAAILLLSLYLAMGYDAVFLEYSEHIAVGVRWVGQEDYLYCETTSSHPTVLKTSMLFEGESPNIYGIGDISPVKMLINEGMGHYRNLIKRVTGL